MMDVSSPPPLPRPASTVVIARPAGPAFEVFLVRRHDNVAFMGGAHVFPGGRVDPADYVEAPERLCDGVAAAVARLPQRSAVEAVAFHVAAVRELFEEAGVLLARDGGSGAPVSVDALRPGEVLARWRRDLLEHRVTISGLAEREHLRLALDALTLFAHWVTPEIELRRFDTHFFFASAAAGQEAVHDDRENTHGTWLRPAEAIERCRRGDIALPPPTWTTLRALSRLADIDAAQRWAAAQRAPCVMPCVAEGEDGARIIMLPGDPGCPPVDGFDAEERRFVLEGGRWRPIQGARGS
jgi:8-oxo-dGTP pyrophosphatase MutT (NUDIX family)